jgi:hypothetical protein
MAFPIFVALCVLALVFLLWLLVALQMECRRTAVASANQPLVHRTAHPAQLRLRRPIPMPHRPFGAPLPRV